MAIGVGHQQLRQPADQPDDDQPAQFRRRRCYPEDAQERAEQDRADRREIEHDPHRRFGLVQLADGDGHQRAHEGRQHAHSGADAGIAAEPVAAGIGHDHDTGEADDHRAPTVFSDRLGQ